MKHFTFEPSRSFSEMTLLVSFNQSHFKATAIFFLYAFHPVQTAWFEVCSGDYGTDQTLDSFVTSLQILVT